MPKQASNSACGCKISRAVLTLTCPLCLPVYCVCVCVGALTALQRLGCPATAQQCIAGALNQGHNLHQQQQQQTGLQPAQPWGLLPVRTADHDRQQRQQQQQQVQQLLEAQNELAWRLSDWGLADALNPAGGSLGFSTAIAHAGGMPAGPTVAAAGSQQGRQQEQGFHAGVLAALTALQQRDFDSFTGHVTGAQQACVLKLARSSTQSAAAVNPLLAQLQMLQMFEKGSSFARSSPAAAAAATASTAALSADWTADVTQKFLWDLLPHTANFDSERMLAPEAAEKLSGISFELSDQMLSLQAALTKALRRPDGLIATLQATMKLSRQAGQVNFAAAALQQVQETLHQAVLGARGSAQGLHGVLGLPAAVLGGSGSSSSAELPGWIQRAVAADAGWPLESVKIRWLQGQHQAALKELQGLAAGLHSHLVDVLGQPDQAHASLMQLPGEQRGPKLRARDSIVKALMEAKMLLGKWLASGEGSTSDVLGAIRQLQSAINLPAEYNQQTGFNINAVSLESRALYQLAVCADQQYQVVSSQLASPEFQKQQQVLQTKEQLLEQLASAYAATRNWNKLPTNKQASARQSFAAVARRHAETTRQVALDKQAIAQLQERRLQYLVAALDAYGQCISKGDKHDLQVCPRGVSGAASADTLALEPAFHPSSTGAVPMGDVLRCCSTRNCSDIFPFSAGGIPHVWPVVHTQQRGVCQQSHGAHVCVGAHSQVRAVGVSDRQPHGQHRQPLPGEGPGVVVDPVTRVHARSSCA